MNARSWVLMLGSAGWLCVAGAGLCGEAAKAAAPEPPPSAAPEAAAPSLEQVYRGYEPAFSRVNREKMASYDGAPLKESLRFSRQKLYMNMADVAMDAQVRPMVEKANELAGKGEYRKAAELYRRVMQEYGEDLYQIAEEGVFIPAALYVQRRILSSPKKELAYYRVAYDAAAKDIYERAVRRYSIFDYKELVRRHLATSYGDDALFALGNAAMDGGQYDEARRRYEEIVAYHGVKDEDSDDVKLDRDQVWARLAICYRHLGHEEGYREAVKRIANRSEPTVARMLAQLEKQAYDAFAVRQREGRRSARYECMDDHRLQDPMPYTFSANHGEWRVPLVEKTWWLEPEALPWATETDLIYKDTNVVYSRSLLTGETNWAFGPGGASQDWDFYGPEWPGVFTAFYPNQSILVHEGVVSAHMFVYGPSLVAIDQYSGTMLWAKGPMAGQTEDEWLDRYQASPAAGRGMIVAPVVHDDIRGLTHLSSSAELAAFETRTGKLLWRTSLARVSPLKFTQSRYPRKIRILSSTPLVNDGVVYHSSNAGVVAAVDGRTGEIRWLTRYPQNNPVLDNLAPVGRTWRNDPPLVRNGKLYVTPVDCPYLLCIDKQTGRILWTATQACDSGWADRTKQKGFPGAWRMAGFTADGLLVLTGHDVVLLDPETGQLAWRARMSSEWMANGPVQFGGMVLAKGQAPPKGLTPAINGDGDDYWFPYGRVEAIPTLTKDGRMFFGMKSHNGDAGGLMYSEFCLDLNPADRKFTAQRRWFTPHGFVLDGGWTPPITKRPVNEELEEFRPTMRMAFSRWGVPFEAGVSKQAIVVRYDRKKLDAALAKQSDLYTLFAKAEVARKRGEVPESIRLYEASKDALPSEENDIRRNINLRLYPLYMKLAQWGYQSGDLEGVEGACKKMGATASNPSQEIRALLAYSELHERRGNWEQAVAVLQNAGRHYWREPLVASGMETGERGELMATAEKALTNLLGEVPGVYGSTARQLGGREKVALPDHFLSVADTGEDRVLETRGLVAQRLRALLARSPEAFRRKYEQLAAADLKAAGDWDVGERQLWCWPGTVAGSAKLAELQGSAAQAKGAERLGRTWRLEDLGAACGLKSEAVRAPVEGGGAVLSAGEGWGAREEDNGEPDIVRLALAQRNGTGATAHLLFVGGRKKSAYGNRFTVGCWDMKAGRKAWETRSILLHGRTMGEEGYEVGFEEVLLAGELAIVHGRYDVIGLRWAEGQDLGEGGAKEKKWHFRVPLGFEIQSVGLQGPLLVLCGRSGTVALLAETGEIVWDTPEDGEYYAGPYFRGDAVLTVRSSPAGVSFRRLGSGRLLSWLKLPGLTTNRKHPLFMGDTGTANPAAAEAVEAYPVAFGGGRLAVVDGPNFHMVDVERMELEWSTPATCLDPTADPSYRLWLEGGRLLVLKPYYSVLENAVYDAASGEMLWRRREGGKKAEDKLKKRPGGEGPVAGKEATGLVLGSMVFLGGKAYGIRYEMGSSSVVLVGMDPATGNELMRIEQKGYTDPEAYVEASAGKGCVVVRVQDGHRFEVWQVDVAAGKLIQKLSINGFGRLGEYGGASAVWQGPHLGIWTHEKRKYAAPGK